MAPRFVGGLANLIGQETQKGRECQEARRLQAQQLRLQNRERVQIWEFKGFGEEVGQFIWCVVGNRVFQWGENFMLASSYCHLFRPITIICIKTA